MDIYLGSLKDCINKLDESFSNTELLLLHMEEVKKTLKLICDDLEADLKVMQKYHDEKEREMKK